MFCVFILKVTKVGSRLPPEWNLSISSPGNLTIWLNLFYRMGCPLQNTCVSFIKFVFPIRRGEKNRGSLSSVFRIHYRSVWEWSKLHRSYTVGLCQGLESITLLKRDKRSSLSYDIHSSKDLLLPEEYSQYGRNVWDKGTTYCSLPRILEPLWITKTLVSKGYFFFIMKNIHKSDN